MTQIVFTYAATKLADGRHAVHLYLRRRLVDSGCIVRERRAAESAEKVFRSIALTNDPVEETGLVKGGDPPAEAIIVCEFTIDVMWDYSHRRPVYKCGEYRRHQWDGRWTPVAALMMEQRAYIHSVLKEHARKCAGNSKKEKSE